MWMLVKMLDIYQCFVVDDANKMAFIENKLFFTIMTMTPTEMPEFSSP